MYEQAQRAEAEEEGRIDTVQVGPLTAYAHEGEATAARALLDSAWATLVRHLRSEVSVLPERRYRYGMPGGPRGAGVRGLDVSNPAEVVRDVHLSLRARIDPTGTFVDRLPFEPLDPTRRTGVYLDLVTATSRAARSCYLGEISGCREALSLGGPVDGVGVYPLDEHARRLLVQVAVELGGEGAYRRLLAPEGAGLEVRLAAAAGVEIDSVLAAWRAEVLESVVHRSPGVDPLTGVASLAWIAAFLFLACRSTRWRLN